MKLRSLFLTLILLLVLAVPSFAQTPQDIKHLHGAVTLLYQQTEDGGQRMLCTATVYRKIVGGYRFASAAHCVEGDTSEDQSDLRFFVTTDTVGTKKFISAKLIEAGNKLQGDDFSIFEVVTEEKFEVVPLGDESQNEVGDKVINVAAPLGLGLQYFEGYVSSDTLDRPKIDADEVVWKKPYLVAIGGGPGSSGSAIVSVKQHAIVGFLVGHNGGISASFFVVPVSQFKAFEAKVDAKTYKKDPPKPKFSLKGLFGG